MVVKTLEEARANFENSIAYIPDRYTSGVDKADWAGPAKSDAAEKNYADAVTKAVANKSRQKGVADVSNEDWKSAAKTKGAPIIGERIRMNLSKWAANFGPVYSTVVSKVATLPPKTTNWRNNITNRLIPTVEAWKKGSGKA